jgi:hypothetical protein
MFNEIFLKVTTNTLNPLRKQITFNDLKKIPDNPFTVDRLAWNAINLNKAEKIYVDTVTDLTNIPDAKTDLIWLINNKYNIRSDFPWNWRPRKSLAMSKIWDFPRVSSATGKVITWDCVRLIPNIPLAELLKLEKVQSKIQASYNSSSFDIVHISFDERQAEFTFQRVKYKAPKLLQVKGVDSIAKAHQEAGRISKSEMVWIVDADAILFDTFEFDFQPPESKRNNTIYVWQAKNPINGLIYGHGAIKLVPKSVLETLNVANVDVATSALANFIQVEEVSNYHQFNTDPFNTWRTAFRECAKLARGANYFGNKDLYPGNEKNKEYLNAWCKKGKDEKFGKYCIKGANAGKAYGKNKKNDMHLINNYEWLKQEFIKSNTV